jgi:cobyric acid synthase
LKTRTVWRKGCRENGSRNRRQYNIADSTGRDLIDIAVIRFPRMSNFTDFNVFKLVPGVSVAYVKSPAELGNPDMIILTVRRIPWGICFGCAKYVDWKL